MKKNNGSKLKIIPLGGLEQGKLTVNFRNGCFRFSAKEPLIHDADLFCEQLDLPVIIGKLCIGLVQLRLQGKELIL